MQKFIRTLTQKKLAAAFVILALLGGLGYYQYEEHRKEQARIEEAQRAVAARRTSEVLRQFAKQAREAWDRENHKPTDNIIDPMTPTEELQTPEDELNRIKAWNKLTPEQKMQVGKLGNY